MTPAEFLDEFEPHIRRDDDEHRLERARKLYAAYREACRTTDCAQLERLATEAGSAYFAVVRAVVDRYAGKPTMVVAEFEDVHSV